MALARCGNASVSHLPSIGMGPTFNLDPSASPRHLVDRGEMHSLSVGTPRFEVAPVRLTALNILDGRNGERDL
jgi:hypothetical protein